MYLENPLGYISLASSAVNFVVAFLILKLRPGHPANRWGFLAFLTFGIWTAVEAVERFYPLTSEPPVLLGKLLVLPEPYIATFFLLFALTFPTLPRRRELTLPIHLLVFTALMWSIIILATPLVVRDMGIYTAVGVPTWGVVWGYKPVLVIFFAYLSLLAGTVIYIFARKYIAGSNVEAYLVEPLLWGIAAAFALVVLTGVIPPLINIAMYPLTSPATCVIGVSALVALFRFSRTVPAPSWGRGVKIFEESSGDFVVAPRVRARELLRSVAGNRTNVLAMTVESPEEFRRSIGLENIQVLKFDTAVGRDVVDLRNPYHVEMIHYIAYSYLQESRGGVVFIEGLNLYRDTVDHEHLLKKLEEVPHITGGTVIISEVSP